MSEEEFCKKVDAILRNIGKYDYVETLAVIDRLENDALAGSSEPRQVALSCADLRLDAALATAQPYAECERRYNGLVSLAPDALTQLLKSVIFAQEASAQKRRVVETHVRFALQRAHEGPLPESLVQRAEELLAAAARGEF